MQYHPNNIDDIDIFDLSNAKAKKTNQDETHQGFNSQTKLNNNKLDFGC